MPKRQRSTRAIKKGSAEEAASGLGVEAEGLSRENVHEMAENVEVSILGGDRKQVVKQMGNAKEVTFDQTHLFEDKNAIQPPFEPIDLIQIFESSAYLAPNIASYVTNIDAFGHRFDPTIDFKSAEAIETVRGAMIYEMLLAAEAREEDVTEIPEISEEEVQKKIDLLKVRQKFEKFRLEEFFNALNPELSFVAIRKRTRLELEITGNAYWEVLRNRGGAVSHIEPIGVTSMRLLHRDKKATRVDQWIKTSPIKFEKRSVKKRFRKYVQLTSGGTKVMTGLKDVEAIFFKEFGDPRIMSDRTGETFETVELMHKKESDAGEATEVLHFKIYSPRSVYGIPRWIGVLISVLGSRHSEEVNFLYFENKSVPPLALLVSGGKIGKGSKDRIRDFIHNELRGKRNFHKVLIIEAQGSNPMPGMAPPGQIKLELKPLTQAQQQDALFQNYDERNGTKVGAAFRVPPILRGETKDFNRATAEAAKVFAEEQTYEPERNDFDDIMNRRFLLNEFHVLLLSYRSLAPITRDPERLAKVVKLLSDSFGIVPKDVRRLASEILNLDLPEIPLGWAEQPIALTLAGLQPGMVPGVTAPADAVIPPQQGVPESGQVEPGDTGAMGAANPPGAGGPAPEGAAPGAGSPAQEKADLTTGDLAAGGGLRRPGQGIPQTLDEEQLRRLRERLKELGFLFDTTGELLQFAKMITTLGKLVEQSEKAGLSGEDPFDVIKGTKPEEIETIKVPPGTFKELGIIPDEAPLEKGNEDGEEGDTKKAGERDAGDSTEKS